MNIISSSIREYPRTLFLILILGFLVRVVFISLHDRPLFSDEKEYDQLAYNLARNATYTYDTTPTAYRPIGYPLVLSCVYYVCGHHVTPARLLQAIVDTMSAFLIYLLLVGHPERTRLWGAALWAFFAPAVFYSNLLLSETVFTFLLVLMVWMFTRTASGSDWRFVALGVLLGILTLIKPEVLAFVLVVPFLMRHFEIPLRKLFPITVAFLFVLTPWVVRNYLVFGEVALSSNGGINCMIGNNATSTGAYSLPADTSLLGESNGEFEADHKALRLAAEYVVSNPFASTLNAAKKIARLFESEGALLIMTFHKTPEDASSRYGTKYASLPLGWILVTNFSYFIIVLAGFFGFLSAKSGRLWWFSLSVLITWLVVHAVFFGGGRFHFPLMPLMAAYAAQFLSEPKNSYESLSRSRKGIAYIAVTMLSTLWLVEGYVIIHA